MFQERKYANKALVGDTTPASCYDISRRSTMHLTSKQYGSVMVACTSHDSEVLRCTTLTEPGTAAQDSSAMLAGSMNYDVTVGSTKHYVAHMAQDISHLLVQFQMTAAALCGPQHRRCQSWRWLRHGTARLQYTSTRESFVTGIVV
jgi:hypothetical protein